MKISKFPFKRVLNKDNIEGKKVLNKKLAVIFLFLGVKNFAKKSFAKSIQFFFIWGDWLKICLETINWKLDTLTA